MRWYAGGVDVNIGSTTDWPMEAHLLRFTEGLPVVASTSLSDTVAAIELSYIAPARSELCRHYPMAMALRDLDLSRPVSTSLYKAPTADECDNLQKRWATSSAELQTARAQIARRFDQDPAYARRVLAIAAGASLREYHTPHLGSLIK
jgi:hypothetical protein